IAVSFAGIFAHWFAGLDAWRSVAFTGLNVLETLVIAGVVRSRVADIHQPDLRAGRIATLSTLVACGFTALLAAMLTRGTGDTSFLGNFSVWYGAHVMGAVFVGTLTAVAHAQGSGLLGRPGKRVHFAVSMLLIALVVGSIFAQPRYPLLYLAFLPLLWAALRHRFAGVVMGVAVLAIIATAATTLGSGPMHLVPGANAFHLIFMVQAYILAACLLTFPVALMMAERSRLAAKVRYSEAHYRMLADYSHDVVIRMRADGQRLYVSPSSKDILGWEPGELLKTRWDLVHPDDRPRQRQEMAQLLADGIPYTTLYRVRHKGGYDVWLEAVGRLIPAVDDKGGPDVIYAGRDVTQRVIAEESLKASQQELENLARVDSLTGLANRRQFDERLLLALARSRRHGTPVALLYMDIDYFKRINDSLGHLAGDAVLKDFAQRLSTCVRTEDLVARLGGDEFVMLVEDAATAQGAEVIARKLIGCVSRPSQVDGADTTITTSIGIALCLRATNAEELMWYADKALYVAKGNGRNTFHLVTME
ncbi:MAG: diguanylate cyclase, partial [Luteimonas sp.]